MCDVKFVVGLLGMLLVIQLIILLLWNLGYLPTKPSPVIEDPAIIAKVQTATTLIIALQRDNDQLRIKADLYDEMMEKTK